MTAIKRTTVHHLVGKRFVGITPEAQRVMIDGESHARTGMGPMDLVLNAVGACAGYDIAGMLTKRRLDIKSYHIELQGTRAEGHPAYYTRVHATHYFDVPGLDQKTAERFVELGMTRYCSVSASLKADITFDVVLEHDSDT